MVSAISCIERGSEYILVSCPTGKTDSTHTRSDGKIFTFEVKDEEMNLVKATELPKGEFMYSCLSELKNGSVAILYESADGKIEFTAFEKAQLLP